MGFRARALALLVCCLVAFGVRAAGFEFTFLDDGAVAFTLGDATYHARLAQYALARFPGFLSFDPYINYPDGAFVPYPPLHDLLPAALVRAVGGSEALLERVLAWSPAVYGTLALLPIYALGRRLRSDALGLGAALFYALLPLATLPAIVGNADHHAAVGLLGASWLWLIVAVLDRRTSARRRAVYFAALALVRLGLLGVWGGSLLYLAPAALVLVASGVLERRGELLVGELVSGFAVALAIAPIVAMGEPVGGPLSAVDLSYLHVLVLVASAGVAGVMLAWESLRPSAGVGARAARLLGVGVAAAGGLLLVPELRAGLGPGLAFVAKSDAYLVMEQSPLLPFGRPHARQSAEAALGYGVYLIPLVPFVWLSLARVLALRSAALFLAAWSAFTGGLSLYQSRFGNDFLPAGCLGFALILALLGDRLREAIPRASRRSTALVVLVLGALLSLPGLPYHRLHVGNSLRYLAAGAPGGDRATATVEGTLMRFAQMVRRATPETAGFLDATGKPEYAVLAEVSLAHSLQYYARRPTPADTFGPYIGIEGYQRVRRFFRMASEPRALALARALGARYLVTQRGPASSAAFAQKLHHSDGRAVGSRPRSEHLRLVTEGPARGPVVRSLGRGTPGSRGVPYKLFEIVEGAVLAVAGRVGAPVIASVRVVTPGDRAFVYRAEAEVGPDGVALLRVPYATRTRAPARPRGPYEVRVEGRVLGVHVPESAVRGGSRVDVPATGAAAPRR